MFIETHKRKNGSFVNAKAQTIGVSMESMHYLNINFIVIGQYFASITILFLLLISI